MLSKVEKKSLKLNKGVMNVVVNNYIEQDIIVPDTKPDALKIVTVFATPYVQGVENMKNNKLKVTLKVNYFIIYNVSDEKFTSRGLYVTHDYTEVLEVKGIPESANITVIPICKNIVYALPNERKISVKLEIAYHIFAKETTEAELIQQFDPEDEIECKMCQGTFNNIKQMKRSIIASKEDTMLPKDSPSVFEILKADARIKNDEFKESYNKIMVKGDIVLELLYLSDSVEEPINKVNMAIPFSSMIELENINDRSRFNIDYQIQNFDVKVNPDLDARTLSVGYEVEANVTMYEEEDIEYVEDFYSQKKELKYDENRLEVVKKDINTVKSLNVKENISQALPENTKLIDYNVDISYLNPTINQNNVNVSGNMKLNLLYQDQNTQELESKSLDIMIDENFNLESVDFNTQKVYVDIIGKDTNITQSGSDIEVKITLYVQITVEDMANISIVGDIEGSSLDHSGLNSINIYVVKSGDTLWNIAKKYKTSVDKITKTNQIENPDIIHVGEKLLIIR